MNKGFYNDLEPIDTSDLESGLQNIAIIKSITDLYAGQNAILNILIKKNIFTEEEYNKTKDEVKQMDYFKSQYDSLETQEKLIKESLDALRLVNKGTFNENSLTPEEKVKYEQYLNEFESAESIAELIQNLAPDREGTKNEN